MEEEANNKRKVIAEPLLVVHILKGAEGALLTIIWVGFQKKRSVVNKSRIDLQRQGGRGEHMVQGMPLATETIVAWCAMKSLGFAGDILQPEAIEFFK